MSEFNNRINTQREALKVINSAQIFDEPLMSLSDKAMLRWIYSNQINHDNNLVVLLKEISGKLFFLANKSQEQITEEYGNLSTTVEKLIRRLEEEVALTIHS